jgi:hypothetical protein
MVQSLTVVARIDHDGGGLPRTWNQALSRGHFYRLTYGHFGMATSIEKITKEEIVAEAKRMIDARLNS